MVKPHGRIRLPGQLSRRSTGTAYAAALRRYERDLVGQPPFRYVTAALHVDYVRPTPIDAVLEVRSRVKEIKGRKVVVESTLSANGEVCARGEVVAVQLPPTMMSEAAGETP
jgi:acyl-CoA thioesterase FadM